MPLPFLEGGQVVRTAHDQQMTNQPQLYVAQRETASDMSMPLTRCMTVKSLLHSTLLK